MIWGSISKTTNIFWNILGCTYWLQSIQNIDTRNFCLFICEVTTAKVNVCFYKQCSQAATPLAKKKNTLVSENVGDEKNIHLRNRKFIFLINLTGFLK